MDRISEDHEDVAGDRPRNISVDKAIDHAGGCGCFQIFVQISISFGIVSISIWMMALGYFLQTPEYKCTYLGETVPCERAQICAEDSQITSWHVDWQSEKSLDNWITRFDLHCEPKWKLALPGACAFIFWTISSFIFPPLSDIYGRKKFFIVGQVITFGIHFWMWMTRSYIVIIVMCALCGVMTPIRVMIAYNYMIEMLPKRWQIPSGLTYLVFEGLTFIYATVFFRYNKDWTSFFCIAWILNLLSLVTAPFLPESPIFL